MKEEDNNARCTKLFKIFFPEVLFPFIPFRSNGSPFGNSTIQFSCVLGTFEESSVLFPKWGILGVSGGTQEAYLNVWS